MSDINCAACDELRRHSPTFVNEGVTDEICASLQNNTGLNPNAIVIHRNDEDLHNANDCLIARMYNEVVKVEVCDWKEFMQKFIPNLYELQKALICDSTGIWLKIDDLYIKIGDIDNRVTVLEEKVEKIPDDFDPSEYAKKSDIPPAPDLSPYALKSEIPVVPIQQINKNTDDIDELQDEYNDLCLLLNQSLTGNMDSYGVLTGASFTDETKKGGAIATNASGPVLTKGTEVGWNRVGVYYLKRQFRDCSGETKTYEWIQPTIAYYNMAVGDSVQFGDVLWTASRATCVGWGMTDALLNWLRDFPQWWSGYGNAFGLRTDFTLSLTVENDALTMKVIGGTGKTDGNEISADTHAPKLVIS